MIAILCNQTLVILTVTLTMTDVPSKHVWKIKESRIVCKEYDSKVNYMDDREMRVQTAKIFLPSRYTCRQPENKMDKSYG